MSLNNLNEGQDSFLDIIANLVGVLIILVVIVGAQATSGLLAEPDTESAVAQQAEEAEQDLAFETQKVNLQAEQASRELVSSKLRLDLARLEMQANDEKRLAQQLATRRHTMLMQLEFVRAKHEQRKKEVRDELNQQQQKQLELQSEKIQLVSQLESLEKSINAVSVTQIETSVETIDHFPNPIAKTVFSNEIHFRLDRGRIVHVPMDQLIEQMKGEIRLKAEKLKQADGTRETIGPVNGFRLQYELGIVPDSQTGQPNARVVRFKRFTIQPVSSDVGEPMEQALQEGSHFMNVLSRLEPRRTTVSVWVYPNSYDSHAKLKDWLHEHGFQMASWPLSAGRPISGGPDGFRTSAQ
ncbi:hypothetical protein [Mariniblastus fucicola]|uniref:Uncharacterized protein n=1 Tax=Mariniblastus fucicola TaxID=980251 RepID=A0A5B9PGP5_9BACT|nr:hypothetical protein [Mariniblastus fucicola]QEG23932.1 hypothetical protein MFFC18_38370 [Mariniblastus fucicola]